MILDPRAYWSLSSVAEFAEVSESTARRIVAQPDFPSAIRVYEGAHPRWKAGGGNGLLLRGRGRRRNG